MALSPKIVTNMVTHKMCHQHCHQIDHKIRWITKLITKFVTKFVTKHPGAPIWIIHHLYQFLLVDFLYFQNICVLRNYWLAFAKVLNKCDNQFKLQCGGGTTRRNDIQWKRCRLEMTDKILPQKNAYIVTNLQQNSWKQNDIGSREQFMVEKRRVV